MTLVSTYKALLLAGFQQMAQYRIQSLLWMLFAIIRPVIFLAAWIAIATAQGGSVAGYTVGDFAAYYVCLAWVSQLVMAWNSQEFEWEVNQGRLSAKLLRPLHPIHYSVIDNIVYKLTTLPVLAVILVIISVAFNAHYSTQLWHVVVFVPSVILAAALFFVFGYIIACLAFWATRMRTANTLWQRASFIFAGQIAPIALMPGWLQAMAYGLPFWYMQGAPTEILQGTATPERALSILAGQAVWLIVCCAVFRVVWRRGVRAYSAVGA
ncbi:MAG TPA: ABC-2 family transporter protein [Candidatus Saccharimonadales bacterium]|jgi:ABC-2 type transport system permease protein|nr:ABC-2 family transporter protein [Candidatus Saccharimonadales bacterium]